MNKKVIKIFITVVVTIIMCGCSCLNMNQEVIGSDNIVVSAEEQEEEASYTNIYRYGSFGDVRPNYGWDQWNNERGFQGEKIACKSADNKYFKLDDSIYSVDENGINLIYKNNHIIQGVLGADDRFIVFATYNLEKMPDSKCVFWKYDLQTGENTKLFEDTSLGAYLDNEYLIIEDNKSALHFCNIHTSEEYEYDTDNKSGEIPDGYCMYQEKILRKEQGYDIYILGFVESDKGIEPISSYDIKPNDVGARINAVDGRIIFLYVIDCDGRGGQHKGLSGPDHCDTKVWEYDEIDVFDMKSHSTQVTYKDEVNRIIGYNHIDNVVYLYSFENNSIEAKDLDDNSINTIAALSDAQTIKFTWCDKTLFWIYENDGIESYGGYLEL